MMRLTVVLLISALASSGASTARADEIGDSAHAFVLVPLMVTGPPEIGPVPVPGSHGSLWATELVVYNGGGSIVELHVGRPNCDIPCFGPDVWDVRPEEVLSLDGTWIGRPSGLGGILFFVRRQHANLLTWSLRVRDLSRESTTWGTDIPVLTERDLLSGRAQLLDVPLRDGFRSSVRIYNLDSREAVTGALRLFNPETGEQMGETAPVAVTGACPGYRDDWPCYPQEPGFAFVPDLQSLARSVEGVVRVEVELPPGVRFWTFASVTHNETQHVTIVTP